MVLMGSRLTGTHTPARRAERCTSAGMPKAMSAAISTSWMRARSSALARRSRGPRAPIPDQQQRAAHRGAGGNVDEAGLEEGHPQPRGAVVETDIEQGFSQGQDAEAGEQRTGPPWQRPVGEGEPEHDDR